MSTPAFLRTFFTTPEIREYTTGLSGLTKLSKSLEHSSPDLQPSVREKYSPKVLTTQRLAGSSVFA